MVLVAEPTKKEEEDRQEPMKKGILGGKNGGNYESQNVGELIFEFFDDDQAVGLSSWGSSIDFDGGESFNDVEEEEGEEENGSKAAAAKAFWDSQEELLVATLRRTTSLESRIRKTTKEALMELNSLGVNCVCRKMVAADGCRECTQRQVCDRLQKDGFSCRICKSKWSPSPEIPAGEHTYLEVVQNSITSTKSDQVTKVIIELNFKSEFKMARACEEYDRLINKLPDVFVGKSGRLKSLIKILCGASKKCMKENKMHMAPWRKHKYMQAKWLGKPDHQNQSTLVLPSIPHLEKSSSRPRASMLTFDLLDPLKTMHQATMIKVV